MSKLDWKNAKNAKTATSKPCHLPCGSGLDIANFLPIAKPLTLAAIPPFFEEKNKFLS
jgi:hypothetical protein